MHASSVRYQLLKIQGLVLLAALAASATAAAAEPETSQPAAEKPGAAKETAEAGSKTELSATAAVAGPAAAPAAGASAEAAPAAPEPPSGMPPWQKAPGIDYWKPGRLSQDSTIDWHGNLETDLGYADYKFSNQNYPPETFNDFRGRFVVGPLLEHSLGSSHFVRATGQMVGWVRGMAAGGYQITMDDVYGQVGKKGVWDFKFGRFMSWTVYRKGLGYDLYTLEDTGALVAPPIEGGQYGVRYEVNNIWYREYNNFGPGRAALHLYPTSWSGVELLGQYGRNFFTNDNQLGARGALNVHSDYVSFSAGAEWLQLKPGGERSYFDANDNKIICDTCGLTRKYGFGGGLVSKAIPYVELGVNAAMGFERQWDTAQGVYNKNAEATIKAFGGYLQFDAGKAAFNRSVILGVGPNHTTRETAIGDKETHLQIAAYVAYPLGFNNSVVKLVVTQSKDDFAPNAADAMDSRMFAARIRFAMYY